MGTVDVGAEEVRSVVLESVSVDDWSVGRESEMVTDPDGTGIDEKSEL